MNGKQHILTLAKELISEFGNGYDEREIRKIRQSYIIFPIRDSLSPESENDKNQTVEKQDSLSPVLKIIKEGELYEKVVVRKFRTTTQHGAIAGKTQEVEVNGQNLDVKFFDSQGIQDETLTNNQII